MLTANGWTGRQRPDFFRIPGLGIGRREKEIHHAQRGVGEEMQDPAHSHCVGAGGKQPKMAARLGSGQPRWSI